MKRGLNSPAEEDPDQVPLVGNATIQIGDEVGSVGEDLGRAFDALFD